jgi:hypothetical protein
MISMSEVRATMRVELVRHGRLDLRPLLTHAVVQCNKCFSERLRTDIQRIDWCGGRSGCCSPPNQSTNAPAYLVWTSAKGLLFALSVEHAHADWPKEGLRLARYESFPDY